MSRRAKSVSATIASGAALSEAIDVSKFASGSLIMPGTWTAADLGIHVCDTATGTFVPLKDTLNGFSTDVSIDGPVASAAYPFPDYWFGSLFIKLWSHNGAGTDTNQAADRVIKLMLKD